MDKKDFENLSESELRELKESIEDVLEAKKFRGRYIQGRYYELKEVRQRGSSRYTQIDR